MWKAHKKFSPSTWYGIRMRCQRIGSQRSIEKQKQKKRKNKAKTDRIRKKIKHATLTIVNETGMKTSPNR